jgi:nitroreductase
VTQISAESVLGNHPPIVLPAPSFENGGTLFAALRARRTSRAIGSWKITIQQLSDILWAAAGVNRAVGPFGGPGLTAGSASDAQEIAIYVAMEDGTCLYEPVRHQLLPVNARDIRELAIGPGQAPAGAQAPVRLIYIADVSKLRNAPFQEPGLHDAAIQKSYFFVDMGMVAQNVYLAAASLGLAAWLHNCDKAGLRKELALKPEQVPLFGQTIGYAED